MLSRVEGRAFTARHRQQRGSFRDGIGNLPMSTRKSSILFTPRSWTALRDLINQELSFLARSLLKERCTSGVRTRRRNWYESQATIRSTRAGPTWRCGRSNAGFKKWIYRRPYRWTRRMSRRTAEGMLWQTTRRQRLLRPYRQLSDRSVSTPAVGGVVDGALGLTTLCPQCLSAKPSLERRLLAQKISPYRSNFAPSAIT